jgi:hypothetical protein
VILVHTKHETLPVVRVRIPPERVAFAVDEHGNFYVRDGDETVVIIPSQDLGPIVVKDRRTRV